MILPLPIVWIFLFLIGSAFGSFLNVVGDRVPRGKSLMGRSHCDFCRRKLSWYELIPVLSLIFQKGRSRCCGKSLSAQYAVVEAVTGLVFVFLSFLTEFNIFQIILLYILSSLFIAIIISDFKYHIIPDSFQLIFLISAVIFRFSTIPLSFDQIFYAVRDGGAVLAPILFLYLITRGKGMGFGDVKLAFCMGVFLGFQKGLLALYMGFLMGAFVGVLLLVAQRKSMKSKIAFGPFLLAGTVLSFLFGEQLLSTVLRLYGF